jgi:hypothetical protein
MHEIGHAIGLSDLDSDTHDGELMDETLAAGERHITTMPAEDETHGKKSARTAPTLPAIAPQTPKRDRNGHGKKTNDSWLDWRFWQV